MTQDDILKSIQEYQRQHPEIIKIMEVFQISQKEYERALKAMFFKVKRQAPAVSSTNEVEYNANVSISNR